MFVCAWWTVYELTPHPPLTVCWSGVTQQSVVRGQRRGLSCVTDWNYTYSHLKWLNWWGRRRSFPFCAADSSSSDSFLRLPLHALEHKKLYEALNGTGSSIWYSYFQGPALTMEQDLARTWLKWGQRQQVETNWHWKKENHPDRNTSTDHLYHLDVADVHVKSWMFSLNMSESKKIHQACCNCWGVRSDGQTYLGPDKSRNVVMVSIFSVSFMLLMWFVLLTLPGCMYLHVSHLLSSLHFLLYFPGVC